MKRKEFTVKSEKNPEISMHVIPGHFATSSSHISHYLDMGALKTSAILARGVAKEIAIPYMSTDIIDTIICMEDTEIIGAYLAEELFQEGFMAMSSGNEIHVLTPKISINGQLIFQPSESVHIYRKNVILLMASVSSGTTVSRALECLYYYGGSLAGISAIFSATPVAYGEEVHSIFSSEDIPGYWFDAPNHCELCKDKVKLDAIVSSMGYTELSR